MKYKPSVKLLWTGVVLYITSIIVQCIWGVADISQNQKELIALFGQFPWVAIIMVVIVAPICEEFAFRGWILGKPIFNIITCVEILVYMTIMSVPIWLTIVSAIALAVVFFKKNTSVYIKAVVTSAIFALVHLDIANPYHYITIVFQAFGGALVFCYIGLRYKLYWAMFVHGLYNLILVFVNSGFDFKTTIQLDHSTYSGEMIVYQFINPSSAYEYIQNTKAFGYTGSLTFTAKNILDHCVRPLFYKISEDSVVCFYMDTYSKMLNINVKSKDSNDIDYCQLFNDITSKTNLYIDTSYVQPLIIKIPPDKLHTNKGGVEGDSLYQDVEQLAYYITERYGKVVVADSTAIDKSVKLSLNREEPKSFEQFEQYMAQEYGIAFSEAKNRTIKVVTVSVFDKQ